MSTLMSDDIAVLATVDPDALTATTHDSDWVDMTIYDQIMVVVMAGTLGSSATLDAAVQQATDSSGTGVKAITPAKAITQLTDAGTDSDKQAIVNLRADELDVANDFTHARVRLTVATATSDGAAVILGRRARHAPAFDNDLSTVDEIVA